MDKKWFEDVTELVRDQADVKVFPGDPDPIEAVLRKFAAKILGSCHNDGVYGEDGCVACRAFRTEKAEGAVDELVKARDEALNQRDDLNDARVKSEAFIKSLQAEVDGLDNDAVNTSTTLAKFMKDLSDSRKQLDDISAENGELQKHVNVLSHQNAALETAVTHITALYDNIREHAKKILEG